MKKSVITLLESMDPTICARTSILFSTSLMSKSFRTTEKLYCSLGLNEYVVITKNEKSFAIRPSRLVLSILPYHGISVHRMLRDTLTALLLCHDYIQIMPCVRSRIILTASVKNFIKIRKRRYMKMPLHTLFIKVVKCSENLCSCILGGRLSVCFIPKLDDFVISIMTRYFMLIRSYEKQGISIRLLH